MIAIPATERHRQGIGLCVTTQARLGSALDTLDGTFAVGAVLRVTSRVWPTRASLAVSRADKAFALQNRGNVRLELGVRHIRGFVLCRARDADA